MGAYSSASSLHILSHTAPPARTHHILPAILPTKRDGHVSPPHRTLCLRRAAPLVLRQRCLFDSCCSGRATLHAAAYAATARLSAEIRLTEGGNTAVIGHAPARRALRRLAQ